jgi:hypothetical protein
MTADSLTNSERRKEAMIFCWLTANDLEGGRDALNAPPWALLAAD